MTLARGRPLRTMPGPSVIPDRVLNAMHREAPNIYDGELIDITGSVMRDLVRVARTEGRVAVYVSNGHGAWEAALQNTLAPGDRVLVLATGRFAHGWAEMARTLGVEVEVLDFGTERAADPGRVEARLREDREGRIRAVLCTQTDTATSVNNDIAALGAAIRAAGHPALFMVDCIACLACEPFEMDAWGVDVMVSACQKGLMTPPGLGLVFAGARAREARGRLSRVSPYFDWKPRFDPEIYYQYFCGTALTHHLFGLRAALDMLAEEGLEAVWARHRALAGMVWAAAEVWAENGHLRPNVPDRAHRSVAVTTVRTAPADADRLRDWCERQAGLTLGIGLGLGSGSATAANEIFRIGHMGHLNPPMLMGALATVDAGLKALGIAHGGGALRVASETLAAATAERPGLAVAE